MAGTFSQIYLQVVFAVKHRERLLSPLWRTDLFKYMSGIITAKGQKAIIVNGVEDHVHAFIGLKPSMCISDLVRDLKNNSARYINETHLIGQRKFVWQEGYGVFSYAQSQVSNVYNYIQNQEEHHRVKSFRDEYLELLRQYEVEFDEKYLFDWYDPEQDEQAE